MDSSLRDVLTDFLAHHSTTRKKDLAQAAGISSSAFSRLLTTTPKYPPSIEVCLRLARATKIAPTKMLRAARRTEAAELLDALYGPPPARRFRVGPPVTPHDLAVLKMWRALLSDPAAERAMFVIGHKAGQALKRTRVPLDFDRRRKKSVGNKLRVSIR